MSGLLFRSSAVKNSLKQFEFTPDSYEGIALLMFYFFPHNWCNFLVKLDSSSTSALTEVRFPLVEFFAWSSSGGRPDKENPSMSAAGPDLPTAVRRSKLETATFSQIHKGRLLRKYEILERMKSNWKMSTLEWLVKFSSLWAKYVFTELTSISASAWTWERAGPDMRKIQFLSLISLCIFFSWCYPP